MEIDHQSKAYFTSQLMAWHENHNERSLPWKYEKDPYKIWLSEVLLQQTRALQGLPYYLRFIEAYPAITDMAAAPDDDVFRLWQGLGYYNRCKNMLATARYISDELKGIFPDSYDAIVQLKGIGPYTAAAIASFAYGLPNAVVDGNVYRVLSRFFSIEIPFDSTEGKHLFAHLAEQLLFNEDSASYNQAIMDLGATICLPRNALCAQCPLQNKCLAFHGNLVSLLPVRGKKTKVTKRYFNYLVLKWEGTIWMHKRAAKDIWENLYEPFLIETDEPMDINLLTSNDRFKTEHFDYSTINYEYKSSQRLTHRIIEARFFRLNLNGKPAKLDDEGIWMDQKELKKSAMPKTVLSFLENNLYF